FADTNGSIRELATDFDHPTNSSVSSFGSVFPVPLEGGIASGDSGGGLFIQVDATSFLAGITSYNSGDSNIFPVPQGYGSMSAATRVSDFAGWISDHLSYSAFQGTDGLIASFDTPTLWRTGSPTNSQVTAAPGPQHSVVFNSPALAVTNYWDQAEVGPYYEIWSQPSQRTSCKL